MTSCIKYYIRYLLVIPVGIFLLYSRCLPSKAEGTQRYDEPPVFHNNSDSTDYSSESQYKTDGGSVGFSALLKGSYDFFGVRGTDFFRGGSVKDGFSVSGDILYNFRDTPIKAGVGCEYQFYRSNLSFIPIYFTVYIPADMDSYHNNLFLQLEMGVNVYREKVLFAEDYELNNGLHFGLGLGVIRDAFIAELRSTIDSGQRKYLNAVDSSGFIYFKTGLSVGIAL